MDKHLISTTQDYELAWVIKKMAAEHIVVSRAEIKATAKLLKTSSRRKIYAHFRKQKYAKQ